MNLSPKQRTGSTKTLSIVFDCGRPSKPAGQDGWTFDPAGL